MINASSKFQDLAPTPVGDPNYFGWYATELDLTTAHPVANDGNFAIVGATDTIWVWDGDTTAWVDTGNAPAALPGGADTNVQFNDVGAFAGDPTFTFDKVSKRVSTDLLRLPNQSTGDQLLKTDNTGDVQESGVGVESAPAGGGGGIRMPEFPSAPTTPPSNMLWIERVDANNVKLAYYDGVQTYSVQLSV